MGRFLFFITLAWICFIPMQSDANPCPAACTARTTNETLLAQNACELEMQIYQCQDFEPSEYRRSCCESDLLKSRSNAEMMWDAIKACHAGAVRATSDFFMWLDEDVYQKILKKNEEYRNCNLKCKRAMSAGDPKFDQMSDEKLDKLNAVYIEHIYSENKRLKQHWERGMKSLYRDQNQSQQSSSNSEMKVNIEADRIVKTVYEMARESASKEFQRMQCVSFEHYPEMLCYGLFQMIDPAAAAALVVKSAKLAKLLAKKADRRMDGLFHNPQHGLKRTSPERELFLGRYLNRDFTTVAQREAYIQLSQETKPNSGRLFFNSENSIMRELNKKLNDKNLVTSLTNKHKELLDEKFKDLQKKWGDKVEFLPYSDYKSYNVGMVPKPPLKAVPAELEKELAEAFEKTNKQFADYLSHNNIIRDGEDTDDWFRGALGTFEDQAGVLARNSRDRSGPNRLQHYNDRDGNANLDASRGFANQYREKLADHFKDTPVFEKTASGAVVPKMEVAEILRKTGDNDTIRKTLAYQLAFDNPALQKKIREKLDDQTIESLKIYKDTVDKFSVSPRAAERKVATLTNADQGGMTADFAGLGAENWRATAEALANSGDLTGAIQNSRGAEQEVTRLFNKRKEEFNAIVQKYMPQTVDSGDDFASRASRVVTAQEKQDLLSQVANQSLPSRKRHAFTRPEAVPNDRNMIASHGESIEQVLRTQLVDKIPAQKLNTLIFGMDMQGTTVGTGSVNLIIGERSGSSLTSKEKSLIQEAFKNAVRDFNLTPDPEGVRRHYRPN